MFFYWKSNVYKSSLYFQDAYKAKCPKSGEECKGQCGTGGDTNTRENGKSCSSNDLDAPRPDHHHQQEQNEKESVDVEEEELHLSVGEVQWYQPTTITVGPKWFKIYAYPCTLQYDMSIISTWIFYDSIPLLSYLSSCLWMDVFTIHSPIVVLCLLSLSWMLSITECSFLNCYVVIVAGSVELTEEHDPPGQGLLCGGKHRPG